MSRSTPPLRVVVALDSFKGSLDSATAGAAAARGVRRAAPDADVVGMAIADGGEGTLDVLLAAKGGREVRCHAVDALGRSITAAYAVVGEGRDAFAVLESARTVGLGPVGEVGPDLPPQASTFGLGLQMAHAIAQGVERIVIGLGGSATTDGGTGMLLALGADIRDEAGNRAASSNPLWTFARLEAGTLPRLDRVHLTVLSDVTNPMTGPRGAAATFGAQKGATAEQVEHLDAQMSAWVEALEMETGAVVGDVPGSGAAGGLGGALLALGAVIEPGFERIAAEIGLARAIRGADLVITGEGSLDAQSAMGKVPAGVARLARESVRGGQRGPVVVAVAGRVERGSAGVGPSAERDRTFDGVFPIHGQPRSLAEAMDPQVAASELEATAEQVTRLFLAARRTVEPEG